MKNFHIKPDIDTREVIIEKVTALVNCDWDEEQTLLHSYLKGQKENKIPEKDAEEIDHLCSLYKSLKKHFPTLNCWTKWQGIEYGIEVFSTGGRDFYFMDAGDNDFRIVPVIKKG